MRKNDKRNDTRKIRREKHKLNNSSKKIKQITDLKNINKNKQKT